MKVLPLTIVLRSPLCLSERRAGGQFGVSLDFLPGRVLRAALAHNMLDRGEENSPLFRSLFLQPGGAFFEDATPGLGRTPSTALSCKTEAGFRPERHGVLDTLLPRLAWHLTRPPGVVPRFRCHQCGLPLEPFSKLYRKGARGLTQVSLGYRLLTRVALNRRRYAAEEGMLYSPMVLEELELPAQPGAPREAVLMQGRVLAREDLAEELRRQLQTVEWVGSGTGRGLGHVTVEVGAPCDHQDNRLETRVASFNTQLREAVEALARLGGRPPDGLGTGRFFSLTLSSDALLSGPARTPPLQAMADAVAGYLKAEPVWASASQIPVGGWCTAWGLPRPLEVAVRAGSVFVFKTDSTEDPNPALQRLQSLGVGWRREDGFGAVRVCAEFHVDTRGEWQ